MDLSIFGVDRYLDRKMEERKMFFVCLEENYESDFLLKVSLVTGAVC